MGAFTYDVRWICGNFDWPTYLPKNLTSYMNAPWDKEISKNQYDNGQKKMIFVSP